LEGHEGTANNDEYAAARATLGRKALTNRARLDPYSTLDVARGASPESIKRAFRRLALRYHPDRNPGDPKAEAQFKLINAAYQRLKESGWTLPPPTAASPSSPDAPEERFVRPRHWPDGHPIYYPTAEEIDALMHGVGNAVLLPRLRAIGSGIWKVVAYVFPFVGVGSVALILIVIVIVVLRRLING
jgi:hypothetical protein